MTNLVFAAKDFDKVFPSIAKIFSAGKSVPLMEVSDEASLAIKNVIKKHLIRRKDELILAEDSVPILRGALCSVIKVLSGKSVNIDKNS